MKNSILVIGSVAFDSIETANAKADRVLGGSAVYFSVAASKLSSVNLVAVVGEDFEPKHKKILTKHKIGISDLEVKEGKTFSWSGVYSKDFNEATTRQTDLNVFADFNPKVSGTNKDSKILFLANIDPDLQHKVLKQLKKPSLVACDTMNYWINSKRKSLARLFKEIDILFINEDEIRLYTGEHNIITAGKMLLKQGPKTIIIKKGSNGAMLCTGKHFITFPAYPVEKVVDTTGAGDTFGGGFMGYLSTVKNFRGINNLKKAMVYGTVMSSFNVQGFSVNTLSALTKPKLNARVKEYIEMLRVAA